jgi:hypothetical protein
MKRQPNIEASQVNFTAYNGLIKFNYQAFGGYNRVKFFKMADFEEWLEEHKYLTIPDEYHALIAPSLHFIPKRILIGDFFSLTHYFDYLERLAKLYFQERMMLGTEEESETPF